MSRGPATAVVIQYQPKGRPSPTAMRGGLEHAHMEFATRTAEQLAFVQQARPIVDQLRMYGRSESPFVRARAERLAAALDQMERRWTPSPEAA